MARGVGTAVYFLSVPWASSASCVIFLLAALTDWLDGYLARKARPRTRPAAAPRRLTPRGRAQMNLASAFGAFLDPVADKVGGRAQKRRGAT